MPRPTPRQPSRPDVVEQPLAPVSRLAPATDNGQPFGAASAPAAIPPAPLATRAGAPASRRAGKQLGLRIPESLYDRLAACAEETGIPQTTLVRRALEDKLKALKH